MAFRYGGAAVLTGGHAWPAAACPGGETGLALACIYLARPHLPAMPKEKLHWLSWRRPLFYLLLPVFVVMAFLGFPIPVAPPHATKSRQEESAPARDDGKR